LRKGKEVPGGFEVSVASRCNGSLASRPVAHSCLDGAPFFCRLKEWIADDTDVLKADPPDKNRRAPQKPQ